MRKQIVQGIIRFLLFCLCKIDRSELKAVPLTGPMILVGNHINFLDAPIAATCLYPRTVITMVKKETFENPLFRFLFNTWGSIPVHRGAADFQALRQAAQALAQGSFFAISPEGTRTKDARLIQGNPGVVLVALKSPAPILPIAQLGAENFRQNFRRLKRTPITIKVGRPFIIQPSGPFPNKEERQQIVDEIMYQLARLMPEQCRGYYADFSKATTEYLMFLPDN